MQDWKTIVKNSERYNDFTILDEPKPFKELFGETPIDYVQLHSTEVYGSNGCESIVGFCGVTKWDGSKMVALDGDTYNANPSVYGYNWFTNEGEKCLDILVGDDW